MLSTIELEHLQKVKLDDVDKHALADIECTILDPTLPIAQRLQSYLKEVKNPYLFRCGNTVIKLEYAASESTIDDALSVYLSHLKNP